MMKYKKAYEECMEFFNELSPESREELSATLDEIFGERRCCQNGFR